MSAGKHTPGPWRTQAAYITISSPSLEVCAGEGYFIVASPRWSDDPSHEHCTTDANVMQANARLIAAAPELLEALRSLFDAYCGAMRSEFDFPGRPWTPERDNDVAAIAARDALAKATGEPA